ncbi:ADP-ribosylation factor-related protein 1 [Hordeum vulgare]|nr:ADP-ribosylation factor-related protein 1 [Hordeum vulgare]
MGLWNYGRKGTHDREAGSSSGRRHGSMKEEAASPPRQAAAPFTIAPRPASHRGRQYLSVEGQARRGACLLLRRDGRGAAAGTGGARAYTGARPHAHAVAFAVSVTTSTSSHDGGGGARLMQRVMEDSMTTHDERQWPGLDRAMALCAAGDVAIPEPMEKEEEVAAFPPELVGTSWGWSCTASEMAHAVGAVNWCLTSSRSPEREASPREEVLQASFQHAPVHQGSPAHLWTSPPYVDLVSDGDDDDTGDQ